MGQVVRKWARGREIGTGANNRGRWAVSWHYGAEMGLLCVVGERKGQKCAYLGTFAHLGGDLGIFGFEY